MSPGLAERFKCWLNMTCILFSLTVCASGITCEIPLGHKDLLLYSSKHFIILALMFWIFDPFWVRFCTCYEARAHCQALVCGYPVVPAPVCQPPFAGCISYCLVATTKIPIKSFIKKGRIYSSSQFKGAACQGVVVAGAWGSLPNFIRNQDTESHESYRTHSLLIQPRIPAHGTVLPT